MALTHLHVDGFGHYQAFDISALAPGLNVLYGPNEAGKSTLTAFVQYILFGPIRGQAPEALAGGRIGGRLRLDGPEGVIHIERVQGAPPSVRVGDRPVQTGEEALRLVLGGLDRGLYRAIHAFSAADLTGFDRLGEPELRDRLFTGALAGAGRSVSAAVAQLERRQSALWRLRAASPMGDLQGRLAQIERDLAAARHRAEGLRHTLAEREAAAAEHRAAHIDASAAGRVAQRYAALRAALPHHRSWQRFEAEWHALPEGLPVDAAQLAAAGRLQLEGDSARAHLDAARKQQVVRSLELAHLPAVSALFGRSEEVARLVARAAASNPSLAQARTARIADAQRRLAQALTHAGLADAAQLRQADLSTPTIAALGDLAADLAQHTEARARLEAMGAEHTRSAPALAEAEAALAAQALDAPALQVAAAVEALQRDAPARARAEAQSDALNARIAAAERQAQARRAALDDLTKAQEQAEAEARAAADLAGHPLPPARPTAPELAAAQTRLVARADLIDEAEAAVRTAEDRAARQAASASAAQSARLAAAQATKREAPPGADPRRRTLGLSAGLALAVLGAVALAVDAPVWLAVAILVLGLAVAAASWIWLGPAATAAPTAAPAGAGPAPDAAAVEALVAAASAATRAAREATGDAEDRLARLGLPTHAGVADLVRHRAAVRRARETLERLVQAGLAVTAHEAAEDVHARELAALRQGLAEQVQQVRAWDARFAEVRATLTSSGAADAGDFSIKSATFGDTHGPARGEGTSAHGASEALALAAARCRAAAQGAELRQGLLAQRDVLAGQQRQRLRALGLAEAAVAGGAPLTEAWRRRCADARLPAGLQPSVWVPFVQAATAARRDLDALDDLLLEDRAARARDADWLGAVAALADRVDAPDVPDLATAQAWLQGAVRTLTADEGRHAALERATAQAHEADAALETAQRAHAAIGEQLGALLGRAGVASVEALREAAAAHENRARLRSSAEAAATARDAALGPWAGEPATLTALDDADEDAWAAAEAEAAATAEALRARADAAVAQGARLDQAVAEVQRSGDIATWAAEHTEVQAALDAARRALAVAVIAQALLERTLQRFREAHQPAILQVASGWFATATAGAYTAIEADLEGKGLWVLDATGGRRRAESLSTGATELLHLVLRLGLAADVSRRGTPLPLVLDDVLVNLDPERAAPVADLLGQVAKQTQILLLTCRPETARLLAERVNDARTLELARFAGRPAPVASAPTASQRSQHSLADQQVLAALAEATEPLSRTELIERAGIESQQWTPTIKRLKEGGLVQQIGEKRGARYQLSD